MHAATLPCPPAPSDAQLLDRFASGERPALDELFRRYRQPAYRVAYRLLGHEADALDAVQEGFVKALTHLDSFQGRSSFKTWLLRVVCNAALDMGRQRGRRESLSLGAAEVGEGPAVADVPGLGLEQADLRRLRVNGCVVAHVTRCPLRSNACPGRCAAPPACGHCLRRATATG